jgi:HD-GYP domain-containing protein (c-di-GMP phosphodiesterase class II)
MEDLVVTSKKSIARTEEKTTLLSLPVLDLNGVVVLGEGSLLSKQLVKKIAQSAPVPASFVPIRRHPTLWKDLNRAITDQPYRSLFRKKETATQWREHLEKAALSTFVVDCLAFFRKHDPYTYWHSLHVFVLTTYMTMELIELPEWKNQFASMGPLHDIGKVNVPIEILKKKTALTQRESRLLRHHTAAGAILLSHFHGKRDSLGPVVALEHHERLDGSGYPFGIQASNPIVEMVAMCDVYDALISPRPYRNRPYDLRTGLEVLTQMTLEGKFSMDTLRFMISLHRREVPNHRDIEVSLEVRGTPPERNLYGVILPDD